MKKLVALLMAFTLIFLALGCAGPSTNNNSGDINNDNSGSASVVRADWEYIEGNGKMIVGITYFEPMNYKDATGKLVGFETEFTEAVCAKLGVTPVFQVIDWNAKETELSSKNIDCIWNGMTITEERKQNMDLSVSYMDNRQVMVVRATDAEKYSDDENIAGASVVAEEGSTGEDLAKNDSLFADAQYTALDAQTKALLEVKAGTADIALIDYTMALASTGEGTDYSDLAIINSDRFEAKGYAIAFRKGSPETLAKVNGAIAELTADGTIGKIAQKYNLESLLLLK